MGTGDQWLGWLAEGGVPAFLCRRDGNRVAIVARTPAFDAAVGPDGGWPGEPALLAKLASVWPDGDGSPALTHLGDSPDWQCVLQALDDPPSNCLGMLRGTTLRERYNDSFFATVQMLPDIVARIDRNHRHLYVNPAIERVTGLATQAFIGKSKREVGLPPELVVQWESLVDGVLDTGEPTEQEHELPTVHGPRQFLTRVVPERAADGTVRTVLSTSHDITQLKSLQQQLAVLASTDTLTSLLNRRGFVDRLDAELSRIRPGEGQLSLVLLDVDQFKAVNDTYGHIVGDNVLMAIGAVLHQEIGDGDFAARLGGDEFCVGLVGADDEQARAIGERIRRRITGLGPDDHCPCEVRVSIGFAAAGEAEHSVSEFIARVDESMYREKSRNPNRSR